MGSAVAWAALLTLVAPYPGLAEPAQARTILVAQADSAPAAEEEPIEDAYEGGSSPPAGVEVLRVRGRGLSVIQTDVPSSVTQFDAATIEALGAQDVSDLARVTPNVNIVQPGATQATFFVRGVGLADFSSNAAGAVTILQDDVQINAPAIQTGQLFDIEGVDVVRGPQGSGPFRNASAGAIRARSRRPTGQFTAQLRSSLGFYDAKGGKGAIGALIQDYEGALEFPIVEDLLSSRFAFRLREADPYKTNGCGNAPPDSERTPRPRLPLNPPPAALTAADICGERSPDMLPRSGRAGRGSDGLSNIPEGLPRRVGDQGNWAARGTFQLHPVESEFQLFLNVHGSRLEQDATLGQAIGTRGFRGFNPSGDFGGEVSSQYQEPDALERFITLCGPIASAGTSSCANPGAPQQLSEELATKLDPRPFRGDYDRIGQVSRDAWGGFVTAEWEWYDLEFFALGSFDTYQRERDQDTDFTPDLLFEQIEEDEAWQTYEQLHVKGELAAQPLAWELGAFYLHEVLDAAFITLLPRSPLVFEEFTTGIDIFREYTQTIDSFGLWGEAAWDILDDLTFEAGVRLNYEQKKFDFTRVIGSGELPPGGQFSSLSTKQTEDWLVPTGELVMKYHLSQYSQVYARFSRGFKAGHFNAQASEDLDRPPAKEEINDSWEAGFSGAWFDGRVQGASAFYYYRYQNYQVFLFREQADSPPVLEVINAKEVETYGLEIEGRIKPLEGFVPRIIEGLTLTGNFGWAAGEFIDFQNTTTVPAGNTFLPQVVDFSGNRLQNTPEFKLSMAIDWTLDLGRFGYLTPRYDLSWQDDVFFDPTEGRGSRAEGAGVRLPEGAIGQEAHFLHNLRLTYRTPTSNVEVALWVRNLEDRVYKNFAFDVERFQKLVINFPGDPRSVGLDVAITF